MTNKLTTEEKAENARNRREERIKGFIGAYKKIFQFKSDNDSFYFYKKNKTSDGIWRRNADKYIRSKMGISVNAQTKKEIVSRMKDDCYQCDKLSFNFKTDIVPIKNKVIELDTMKFRKPIAEDMLTGFLPLEYNPNAVSKYLIPFLKKTIKDPDDLWNAFAMIGYCLIRSVPIKAIFWLLGEPNTGKTTFIEILTKFFSPELCSFVNTYDFEREYYLADLNGMMVNIHDDVPSSPLGDKVIANLKWMSGGRSTKLARRAYDREMTRIIIRPKGIFSANTYPGSRVPDEAYDKRCVFISFEHIFPDENRDEKIDMMSTPEELSALLNYSLDHLKELMIRKSFKISKRNRDQINEVATSEAKDKKAFEFMELQNSVHPIPRAKTPSGKTVRI